MERETNKIYMSERIIKVTIVNFKGEVRLNKLLKNFEWFYEITVKKY